MGIMRHDLKKENPVCIPSCGLCWFLPLAFLVLFVEPPQQVVALVVQADLPGVASWGNWYGCDTWRTPVAGNQNLEQNKGKGVMFIFYLFLFSPPLPKVLNSFSWSRKKDCQSQKYLCPSEAKSSGAPVPAVFFLPHRTVKTIPHPSPPSEFLSTEAFILLSLRSYFVAVPSFQSEEKCTNIFLKIFISFSVFVLRTEKLDFRQAGVELLLNCRGQILWSKIPRFFFSRKSLPPIQRWILI